MYVNTCKRVNTRIFDGNIGSFKNPMAGTVIDSCVTDKDVYEFYLVSVAAKQGMSTPTRFSVLYYSIGTTPDQIELLTYKLCYTYYNVSGAIKQPSCIRYHIDLLLWWVSEVARMALLPSTVSLKDVILASISSDEPE